MKPTLHRVIDSELPVLKGWLEKFLPHSFKLYHTVCLTLRGKWSGATFCTLGWPDILAAGEGETNQSCPCPLYFAEPYETSVFSPDPDNLETLLLWPGYLDWSKPILFKAVSSNKVTPSIEKVGNSKGGNLLIYPNVLHEATEADLPPRPPPEGLDLGVLEPDLHTNYAVSTWPHSRKHSDEYIRALVERFPSVGLFDKDGECIGLEIGNEYGGLGMLHVREEYRGRGLGKIITSQLAQKYFRDELPVLASVIKSNQSSRRMHTSCGFREICDIDWVTYLTEDKEEFLKTAAIKNDSLAHAT